MTGGSRHGEYDGLSTDFLDFIVALDEHDVEFVLVGGYALVIHGVVRATGDIDFLFRRTPQNVRRLVSAMMEFGAPPEVIDEEALMTPDVVTQFGQRPFRIDLLNAIDGVSFDEVWHGAVVANIQDHHVRVIGLNELTRNKTATGREKDKEDVRRLLSKRPRRKR